MGNTADIEQGLKPFNELYKLDVKDLIETREDSKGKKNSYLSWSTVLALLYQQGAQNVKMSSLSNTDGYPAFFDKNGIHPFVKVVVLIDENEYQIDYPVINGYQAVVSPSALDIHIAQQRAFVKCVAINTGLGLSLWASEEKEKEVEKKTGDKYLNSMLSEEINRLIKKFGTAAKVYEKLNVKRQFFGSLLANKDGSRDNEKTTFIKKMKEW